MIIMEIGGDVDREYTRLTQSCIFTIHVYSKQAL